jgi:hypothetical protein
MEPAPEQGDSDQPFRLGTGVALESGWNPEAGSAAQRAAAEAHFKVKVASADSHVAALWTDNAWTEFEQARMTLKHFDVLKRNTTNTKMQAVVNFSTIWFVFEQDRYSESTSEDMSGSITRHFIVAGYISRTQRLVRAAFGDGEDDDIALMEVEDQGPGHITYTYLSNSKKNSRGSPVATCSSPLRMRASTWTPGGALPSRVAPRWRTRLSRSGGGWPAPRIWLWLLRGWTSTATGGSPQPSWARYM